jgi:pimeloyl-ACP methyl ester carboxylesterase
MAPEDFAQVMRDTIYALFDGPFPTLGMTQEMLKGIRVPALVMPGSNDIHPWRVAEMVHRLVPNCQWAEIPPHSEEPAKYAQRVLQFLAEVEANSH